MKWRKLGHLYCPDGHKEWARHSFMTPTPILLDDARIRIYGASRDENGVARIGYIDVDAQDPTRLLYASPEPVLDIGEPGMFDDNGVILGDVIRVNNRFFMYYVGFQHVKKAKFLAFTGLAISNDGEHFARFQPVPVMDRDSEGKFINAIHSILYDGSRFHTWYSTGTGWETINGVPYPKYHIKYCSSADGITFNLKQSHTCLLPQNNEYRIGRPRVRKTADGYDMMFTYDTYDKQYISGYARSYDGLTWQRSDSNLGLTRSESGWDNEMAVYPATITSGNRTFMVYNGNGMGKTGVGVAELIEN